MPTVSRPSGEKAIVSIKDRFWTARTQLTLTYTAIVAVILLVSSSVIYTAFSRQLSLRFERFGPNRPRVIMPEGVIPPRPEEVLHDLINSLTVVNGLLLALAAIFSYWFAGATLEPIRLAYERQRRFLSDASHELRTPVAILHADLENTLSDATVPIRMRAQAESHLEETQRMSQIIKDLLLLSQLDEASAIREESRMTDIGSLLVSMTQRFQPLAKHHGVKLTLLSPQHPCAVFTKETLLTHALENLIKNAITYNVPSGRVTIEYTRERSHVRIKIEDTGIGIAQEHVDKIFDRFYRVDKSRSRKTGGSGLGLSITHSVIHQLKGSIELKSVLNKGTTVSVTLPLFKAS